jgi:hypothetical protein
MLVFWALVAVARAGNDAAEAGAVAAPLAVTSPEQVNLKPQRLALMAFEYDPEDGALVVTALEPDGAKRYRLDAINISAIGEGRTIKAELNRVDASSFKGTLNLSEGTWNLVVRAVQGEQRLEGQYALGVGQSVATGRVPLVPPNPEVGRLTWIVGLMFGVPLGLAALVVLVAVAFKQLRAKPSVI